MPNWHLMLCFTVVRNGTKQSLKLGPANQGSQSTVYSDWLTMPSFQYTFHKSPLHHHKELLRSSKEVSDGQSIRFG